MEKRRRDLSFAGGQQCHYEGTRKVCTPEGVHHHLNPDCECKDEWTLNGQTIRGLHDEAKRLPLVRDKGKMPHQLKMERNELEEVQ